MGITSQAPWAGLGFAPFSSPELPFVYAQNRPGDFITEWATGMTQDESRRCARHSVEYEVFITDPNGWESENPMPIRGECLNLSEEGLYAVVPIGYGLGVGQHYRFSLRRRDGMGERLTQLGAIVRTEVLLGPDQDRLGIGVRLTGQGD